MPIKSKLTGLGMPAGLAANVVGTVNTSEAGAGSSNTDATLLSFDDFHIVSTGNNNTGVILPPGNGSGSGLSAGDTVSVVNYTGNTLKVYPPLGGKLNNGSANAAISITNTKGVVATCIDSLNFTVDVSA